MDIIFEEKKNDVILFSEIKIGHHYIAGLLYMTPFMINPEGDVINMLTGGQVDCGKFTEKLAKQCNEVYVFDNAMEMVEYLSDLFNRLQEITNEDFV